MFTSSISALSRSATERPALLGTSSQMGGVGIVAHSAEAFTPSATSYGLEVAGRVASAATAHVSNAVGLTGPDAGLSVNGSAMKLQWCAKTSHVVKFTLEINIKISALTSSTRPNRLPSQSRTFTCLHYSASSQSATALQPSPSRSIQPSLRNGREHPEILHQLLQAH